MGHVQQIEDGGHYIEHRETRLWDLAPSDVEHGIVIGMHPHQLIALKGQGFLEQGALGIVAIVGGQDQVGSLFEIL